MTAREKLLEALRAHRDIHHSGSDRAEVGLGWFDTDCARMDDLRVPVRDFIIESLNEEMTA